MAVEQNITPHEAHKRNKAQSNVVGRLERVLVRSKINDDKQPTFLVGWAFRDKDADIITLTVDESKCAVQRYVGIQSRRTQ